MVEIYLSTDGKHTVHISPVPVSEAGKVLREALGIYRAIVAQLGTKPRLWETVMNGKRPGHPTQAASNPIAGTGQAPLCQVHQTPLVLRQGRHGRFYSCPRQDERGQWCGYTQNAA